MFVTARSHQELVDALQLDINEIVHEVTTAVSRVLEVSSTSALKKFEDQAIALKTAYLPALEKFEKLQQSDCRNRAETSLNDTVFLAGFADGNCASNYNHNVTTEINRANDGVVQIDNYFNQVTMIVAKSFIGFNQFTTPEDIESKIKEIYELVTERWEEIRPETESLTKSLEEGIAVGEAELATCHDVTMEFAISMLNRFSQMVNICYDFDNTEEPWFKVRGAKPSALVQAYEEVFKAFKDEFATAKLNLLHA